MPTPFAPCSEGGNEAGIAKEPNHSDDKGATSPPSPDQVKPVDAPKPEAKPADQVEQNTTEETGQDTTDETEQETEEPTDEDNSAAAEPDTTEDDSGATEPDNAQESADDDNSGVTVPQHNKTVPVIEGGSCGMMQCAGE